MCIDFKDLDKHNEQPLINVYNNMAGSTTFFIEDCDNDVCFTLEPRLLDQLKNQLDEAIKQRNNGRMV